MRTGNSHETPVGRQRLLHLILCEAVTTLGGARKCAAMVATGLVIVLLAVSVVNLVLPHDYVDPQPVFALDETVDNVSLSKVSDDREPPRGSDNAPHPTRGEPMLP